MMWKTSSALLISIAGCSLAIGLAAACAINPQPLPPDTFDASPNVDSGSFDNQSGSGDAAGAVPSADADAGNTGGGGGGDSGDGGVKGTDASSDASTDAADDASD